MKDRRRGRRGEGRRGRTGGKSIGVCGSSGSFHGIKDSDECGESYALLRKKALRDGRAMKALLDDDERVGGAREVTRLGCAVAVAALSGAGGESGAHEEEERVETFGESDEGAKLFGCARTCEAG